MIYVSELTDKECRELLIELSYKIDDAISFNYDGTLENAQEWVAWENYAGEKKKYVDVWDMIRQEEICR